MIGGSGVGWTFYPPLSGAAYQGFGVDYMLMSLHLAGASRLVGSINFICTIYYSVKPSSYMSCKILVWSYLYTSILLVLSLPVLAAGITMLLFDRKFGAAFFDPSGGGDPVLFQHLFWFFGHPEVYVLILPAFGIVRHVCCSCSNKDSMFGYYAMVAAMGCIVCLGRIV